jgi:hypothetical protein
MTCEEYRERWWDRQPDAAPARARAGDVTARGHWAGCAACQEWERREQALDELLEPAFVVAPPPELAARLAQLPTFGPAAAPSPSPLPAATSLAGLLEVAIVALVGLALAGVSGTFSGVVTQILADLSNLLQAIPLVESSPLLGYIQSVMLTAAEALATLLVVTLGLLRTRGPSTE